MEPGKKLPWLKNLLLFFAIFSLGYAFGKNSCGSRFTARTEDEKDSCIMVYYFHSSFRCITCNTIEKMTRDLLDKKYGRELNAGTIRFSEINFQENEKLAQRFELSSSCVVVAIMKKGKIMDFQRLDKVWTKMQKKTEFDSYLQNAITAMQEKLDKGGTE